jgi:peptidoglycan hydrolase CwlO-like protein
MDTNALKSSLQKLEEDQQLKQQEVVRMQEQIEHLRNAIRQVKENHDYDRGRITQLQEVISLLENEQAK